jgi:6-phosphogluconate dehydrogenase
MQLGMIGLGRMGGNMSKRLAQHGHDMKTYDPRVESTASSIAELRDQLAAPRAFWLMVPSGTITEEMFQALLGVAEPGDTIVDGGNSNFRDSQRRHAQAAEHSVHFVDAGVSGGVWGLEVGYCLMAGGDGEPVKRLEPVFTALAPDDGYAHVGPSGSGHFVKMIHNGIEYGLMQAYAEGFEIMHASSYELDLGAISDLWMHGSVVRSWLLELAARAFKANGQDLAHIKGYVADSGEGRWTIQEAIDHDVPAPVITLSLLTRFRSRQDDSYTAKVLAALRNEFGGHEVKTE